MSIKGNQLDTLVRVEGYPRYTSSGGNASLEDQFVCKWSSWGTLIPAMGSTTDQAASLYLTDKLVEREGEMARITLTYSYPDALAPVVDGDDTYESRATVTIDDEGNRLPSIAWVRRSRKSTFSLSASNVTSNVGKRVDPPGLTGSSANEWLKVGREVQVGPDYTDVTDSYEWKDGGWPASYGNGTET